MSRLLKNISWRRNQSVLSEKRAKDDDKKKGIRKPRGRKTCEVSKGDDHLVNQLSALKKDTKFRELDEILADEEEV